MRGEHEVTPGLAPDRLHRLPSWLVGQARRVGDRLVVAELGRAGRRTDYAVLAALEEFGALSQADIGRRLAVDRSDVVALLNGLVEEGLVRREQDPADRRRNAITLTPRGRRLLTELDEATLRAQDGLLAPLDAAERAQLVALLQRVVDHHVPDAPS